MKNRTYRETLEALLDRPAGDLCLVGAEDDTDKSGKDDAGDDDGDNDDDDDAGDGGDNDGDEDDDDDDEDVEALKRRVKNLEDERKRNVDKRKEAQAKVATLQAEIDRLKKDGATDEVTKTQISTLESENKDLKTRIGDMALDNAFLKDNTHAWHDPEAALRLADLSDVEVDDDGTVHGLAEALEALAAKKPFLLKASDEKKPAPKKSGDRPGNGGNGGDGRSKSAKDAQKKAELQSKYPGLRR